MDGHDPLTLTSLSLEYRFLNVLYIWSPFLPLNSFCYAWSLIVTLCHELHYILVYDLYAYCMSLVDAT
jgi:hypothetical protein